MVAGAEVVCPSIPMRGMQCRRAARGDSGVVPAVPAQANAAADPVAVEIAAVGSELELRMSSVSSNVSAAEAAADQFVPSIRSGSFSDIGPRRDMEDEHIRVDDLASHLGSMFRCPLPSAFYGVFDGHGGPDASAYVRKHAMRLFFKDAGFPLDFQSDEGFLEEVANSVRKAFLLADAALADDCTVSSSTGTTALTALILGRCLLIANVGDCRAVLCRKGEAVEMSRDHRPIRASERRRVEECGGYVDDGYVNGMLSVTRVLGDWDMKFPRDVPSPLIAEPEFMQAVLTEDDEFLVIGCDGIWDVMSSQHAVSVVRRGLQLHDDPEKCARELVMEALRLNTFDNLTVIVICFTSECSYSSSEQQPQKLRGCRLSTDALCNLKSWLNDDRRNC